MQQRYILEEFARKISASKYRDSIILKGVFVVSALLGIDEQKHVILIFHLIQQY